MSLPSLLSPPLRSKRLRSLVSESLPLRVVAVQPLAPVLRHAAAFPPLPHLLAGAPRDALAGEQVARCLEPVELMCQLEGSGGVGIVVVVGVGGGGVGGGVGGWVGGGGARPRGGQGGPMVPAGFGPCMQGRGVRRRLYPPFCPAAPPNRQVAERARSLPEDEGRGGLPAGKPAHPGAGHGGAGGRRRRAGSRSDGVGV